MNQNWKNFLLKLQATIDGDDAVVNFPAISDYNGKTIYPVAHLSVLTVSGADAAHFLQGQITCNINDITETQSSLGALCNPKGRAIATFLLVKSGDAFLMILPVEQLAQVKKRLQMYVLRSAVSLSDGSDQYSLIGLNDPKTQAAPLFSSSRQDGISVSFSAAHGRYLVIAETDKAMALWSERVGQGYRPQSSDYWRYLDILAGIPWLTAATSEEFIPQMLNLDLLGGISFNKGCYTGQEIVARTHYLGKAKRALFLAACDTPDTPTPNSDIIDADGLAVGKVLQAAHEYKGAPCKMLAVLQLADGGAYHLKLKDYHQFPVTLLT